MYRRASSPVATLALVTGMALAAASLLAGGAAAQTRLLRFPDIHGERVVFSYAGDLWTAPSTGGTATRLTAHPGLELFPRFSPDGRWIAFTGQYDGDEQVYVIPSEGGIPKQLTWYPSQGPLPPRWGYDHQVYGWSPDGGAVLFRSLRHTWDIGDSQLFTVSIEGGLPRQLPMPKSGAGDFSPDGRQVVYSPLFRDFRAWKRYQGGWAQDLWIFDLETNQARQITDDPRSDRDPMWVGNRIYFSSDRDGKLNLYGYDPTSGDLEQLTHHAVWDARWPSADEGGRIVYELAGELRVFDTGSGSDTPVSIRVPDDGLHVRPSRIEVADNVEDFELSPKGERALFVARGDIFTAPVEEGFTVNLTHSSDAHDKWARWSPDGSKIAFISDMDGEEEIYLIDHDGSGEPVQLTDGGSAMRYAAEWSPDGERLAFGDKEGRLYILEVESRDLEEVADEKRGQVTDYTWSPRGGHLAFSLTDENGFNSIWVWSLEDGELRRVTGEYFNEFSPAWDPAGDFLYYLSDRALAPQLGSFEWNYLVDRETYLYALALRDDVAHPFPPENDEVTVEEESGGETGGEEGAGEDEEGEEGPIRIDFDGLAERVVRIPVEADNYGGLSAIEGHLLFVKTGPGYYGRGSDVSTTLRIFSMEDREASDLAEGIGGYALSPDGSKVLVRQRGGYELLDAKPGAGNGETVSTAGLEVDRVPKEEWIQIFDEVWRRFRDFFYVENMHGYDWEGLRERYRPLLDHVAHRSDLNYVMGEMISELSVSHTYIAGGDFEIPDRARVALPGARFELDEGSERYRLAEIYHGDNAQDDYRAPLTEVGVDAREGDHVLAIDGEELTGDDNPYRLLRHKADRPVELTLNTRPTMDGARTVSYRPVTSEDDLIYLTWVDGNRRAVAEATDGRVGYLHIPDMGSSGIQEWIKWFYGQARKEGLVIDVRGNGGGNVSAMLIERLSRDVLATRFSRTVDDTGTYPGTVFHGHLVCLINETSASDGDIFPAMFREAGLGPLIGKRTWGGVIGITSRGPLIDGGSVNVPEFGFADTEGEWIIEGHGVDPDIEVENTPEAILEGRDPQLERGIEEVLRRIGENPMELPGKPAAPVKTP